jgi:hypothetical protein
MSEAARLFDLALARRLLGLPAPALLAWLDERLPELKAATRRGAAELLAALVASLPPAERAALPPLEVFVAHWDDLRASLAGSADAAEALLATAAIAEKAAFGEARIELDVPGGPARVFGGRLPEGALFDRDVFPGDGPERYLLLQPAQVERLAAALQAQDSPAAAALRELAGRCRGQPGLRVAWLLEV